MNKNINIPGIYQIQSKIKPERIYIGSAVSLNKRWNTHICQLKNNKHFSIKLQRHFNKYGISDLQFSVLIICSKEDLLPNEQLCLNKYKPYFNTCTIAGNCLGIKRSEEFKNKCRGRKHSEESKLKMRKPKSEEHKINLSMAAKKNPSNRKGMKLSEERKKLNKELRVKKLSNG